MGVSLETASRWLLIDANESGSFTTKEPEAKETWRAMDEEAQRKFREGPYSQWPFGAGEIISRGQNIIKVRLVITFHKLC